MGSTGTVYVFGIILGSKGEEVGYGYPHWEPEPPESATEDFSAWEERNPIWGLRDDLDCYLDQDFVEFLSKSNWGPDGDETWKQSSDVWDYIGSYIKGEGDVETIRQSIGDCEEFVLIFDSALGGFEAEMKDTDGAVYAGAFPCTFTY